jgi:hypothetical protein
MSNYTQSTNFATKDALPSGDPLKIVKGTEINTEFVNIAVAVATKADLASPTFTGTVTAPIFDGSVSVTTAQVLTATASASAGDVGSYAFLVTNISSLSAGQTVAGSNTRFASARSTFDSGSFGNAFVYVGATAPSGTWRALGHTVTVFNNDEQINQSFPTLFLRIS